MKRISALLALALLALTSSLALAAEDKKPFVVISDIDDTAKITHVLDKAEAVKNGFFGRKMFTGMPELYQGMVAASGLDNRPGNRALYFLSASPSAIRESIIDQLFKYGHYPPAGLILRPWLLRPDTAAYKQEVLHAIAKRRPYPFILVGDDTEKDPKTFTTFAKNEPAEKTAAIYIRRNVNRVLPKEVIGYYSSLDMGLREFEEGRVSVDALLRVAGTITNPKLDPEFLFPSFYYCPKTELANFEFGPKAKANAELMTAAKEAFARITSLCAARPDVKIEFHE